MDNFWNALGSLISKILLSDLALWLFFVLLGYLLLTPEISIYLSNKTPAYFPSFVTLNELAILVFSLVSVWIIRKIKNFFIEKPWKKRGLSNKKIKSLWENELNEFEREVLTKLCVGQFYGEYNVDSVECRIALNRLSVLKLIRPTQLMNGYYCPQSVKDYLLASIRELMGNQNTQK